MKLHTALAVAMLAALPYAVALGATDIDREIDADPSGSVEVRNVAGSVEITGWSRRAVHVSGTLADNVERLDFRADGDRVIVDVILKENRGSRNHDGGTALEISAPQARDVDVSTVSASIRVRGIEGEQRLHSISGAIETEGFASDLDLDTVSGNVTASGSGRDGVVRAHAVSGSLSLRDFAGQVEAEAVSGAVDVRAATLTRATVRSISGRVSLRGALSPDARVELTSTSGLLDLSFMGDAAAEYDLSSFSGAIRSCFGPPVSGAPFGPQRNQRFREGASNARVRASTMSGAIELCRE